MSLPISEDISETKDLVVTQRVEIEKVGDVNVLHAELIWIATVVSATRLVVVNLDALHFKADVAVLNTTIKLRVAVDKVDGGNMMRDEGKNFLLRFFVNYCCTIRIVVLENLLN